MHLTGARMKGDYYRPEKRHEYARNDTIMALIYAMGHAFNDKGVRVVDWGKVAADMGIVEQIAEGVKADETEDEAWERELMELAAI